jgi:hypothetical protein
MACGRSSGSAPAANEVAKAVQFQVDPFIENARKSPKTAPEELTIMLESLDSYAQSQGEAFAELNDTAKELKAMYDRKAPKAEIDAQLDKLKAQSDALGTAGS